MPTLSKRRLYSSHAAVYVPTPSGAAYVGPGDILTFNMWFGLRAYSAAQCTGSVKACTVCKFDDFAVTTDINITTSGHLDTAAIAALGYETRIIKIYDQTGNIPAANIPAGSTVDNTPILVISPTGLTAGRPAMNTPASGRVLRGSAYYYVSATQPYLFSVCCRRTGRFTDAQHVFGIANGGGSGEWIFTGFNATNNSAMFIADPATGANFTFPDSTWAGVAYYYNGSSSSVRVNSTTTSSLNPGAADIVGLTGGQLNIMGSNAGIYLQGDLTECGYANGGASAMNALTANQQAYWGF